MGEEALKRNRVASYFEIKMGVTKKNGVAGHFEMEEKIEDTNGDISKVRFLY